LLTENRGLVLAILEMTSLSQDPRDRILWILANKDGKMERSRLSASTGKQTTTFYAKFFFTMQFLGWIPHA
jgi:hypothetical protein